MSICSKSVFARTTAFIAIALCAATTTAQAIVVQHQLTQGTGDHWTVQFDITNDGSLAEVSNFTVHFNWQYASNLQLLASPGAWDTIVIAPDAALTSDGFMDALVVDPADVLLPNQTLGGFEVGFDWNAVKGAPQSFDFVVYDASFNPVSSGITVSGQSVPTPPSWALASLGLALLVGVRGRGLNAGLHSN